MLSVRSGASPAVWGASRPNRFAGVKRPSGAVAGLGPLAGCALLLALLLPGLAEPPFKLEPGFVRLDNGKDLSGWFAATWSGRKTGDLSGWSVVDGCIHLDSSKARSHLFHGLRYSANVVIRLQFRASPKADSGICLHGKQFQVRDYPGAGPKQYAPAARPAGKWNELEFDITDGVARIKLNGQVIERAWPIGQNTRLGIGLQREIGSFDFRYIRIKEKKRGRCSGDRG